MIGSLRHKVAFPDWLLSHESLVEGNQPELALATSVEGNMANQLQAFPTLLPL